MKNSIKQTKLVLHNSGMLNVRRPHLNFLGLTAAITGGNFPYLASRCFSTSSTPCQVYKSEPSLVLEKAIQKELTPSPKMYPLFLTGFADAEGSFSVLIHRNKRLKTG